MGGHSSSPLDVVAGVATGGFYTVGKYFNDQRLDAKRDARTAADQQKDAIIAQEADLKKKQTEAKKSAANIALRNRLVAMRGYSKDSSRGGTILTGPNGIPSGTAGNGGKTLLGT